MQCKLLKLESERQAGEGRAAADRGGAEVGTGLWRPLLFQLTARRQAPAPAPAAIGKTKTCPVCIYSLHEKDEGIDSELGEVRRAGFNGARVSVTDLDLTLLSLSALSSEDGSLKREDTGVGVRTVLDTDE